MVKFAKQLELQLVPEWRHKFCDYKQLKKEIRKIKTQRSRSLPANTAPGLQPATGNIVSCADAAGSHTWTPFSHLARRAAHPWHHENFIKVHQKKVTLPAQAAAALDTDHVHQYGVKQLEELELAEQQQTLGPPGEVPPEHHGGSSECTCYYLYETEVLADTIRPLPAADQYNYNGHRGGALEPTQAQHELIQLDRAFFKRLDQELNKVNRFFCWKEQEFLERAEVLSKQLYSLTHYSKAASSSSSCTSSSARPARGAQTISHCFSHLLALLNYGRQAACSSQGRDGALAGDIENEESSRHPLKVPARTMSMTSDSDDNSERPFIRSNDHPAVTESSNQLYYNLIHPTHHHHHAGTPQPIASGIVECSCCRSNVASSAKPVNQVPLQLQLGDVRDLLAIYEGNDYDENLPPTVPVLQVIDPCKYNSLYDEEKGLQRPDHMKGSDNNIVDVIDDLQDGGLMTHGDKKSACELAFSPGSFPHRVLWDHEKLLRSFCSRVGKRMSSISESCAAGQLQLYDHQRNCCDMNCTNSVLDSNGAQLVSGGGDNYMVSMSKIKHAKKMLRTAFVEFYRGLGLLRTFSSLNMVAFAKILKKYDKVTGRQASPIYLKAVEKAHFNTSDKVVKMMDEVERLFTEHFAKDDEKKALMLLRPVQSKAPHTLTFFLGLFSGCSLALIMAFAILLHLQNLRQKPYLKHDEASFQIGYQVFSMLSLVLLHMYLYGWNVYTWRKVRINYAFIFDFAPQTELRHREIFLMCTGLTTFIVATMIAHFVSYSTPTKIRMNPDTIPLVTILVLLSLLLCPFNLCYRSSRVFFLGCMKRIILSPIYKVLLADFFLADQLTSQVAALQSLQFVMCYYFGGYFQTHDTSACGSQEFRIFTYLISFLPYWWRLMQCIRRWTEDGDRAHLENGGKYLSAMAAAAARISHSYHPASAAWLVLFLITSTLATLYQMYWDVVRDWGLFHNLQSPTNPWLRDQLLLKNTSVYYFSIALNLVLRFAWLQQIAHSQLRHLDHSGSTFFFAALEVIRRGHWNFYRLENEHLNNVGKYRAVKSVPLPFRDPYDGHKI